MHQDLGLIPSLSVAENLLLGRLITRQGGALLSDQGVAPRVQHHPGSLRDRTRSRASVESLRPVERALLAITRAVEALRADGDRFGLLVLDEPTQGVDIGARRQIFDDPRRVSVHQLCSPRHWSAVDRAALEAVQAVRRQI